VTSHSSRINSNNIKYKLWSRSKTTAASATLTGFDNLKQLLDQEDGRSRVGNKHLIQAIEELSPPNNDDDEGFQNLSNQLARYKKKKKIISAHAATQLVKKLVDAQLDQRALTLLMDKKKYGLYPKKEAYEQLMRVLLDRDHGKGVIAAFERMVLDGVEKPTDETLQLVVKANMGAECVNRHQKVVAFCKSAELGGIELDDASKQLLALSCIQNHDWMNAAAIIKGLESTADFQSQIIAECRAAESATYTLQSIIRSVGLEYTSDMEPTPIMPTPADNEADDEADTVAQGDDDDEQDENTRNFPR